MTQEHFPFETKSSHAKLDSVSVYILSLIQAQILETLLAAHNKRFSIPKRKLRSTIESKIRKIKRRDSQIHITEQCSISRRDFELIQGLTDLESLALQFYLVSEYPRYLKRAIQHHSENCEPFKQVKN